MPNSESLLLVEDDPAVMASLRRRLQMEGFTVHTAVTGLMALEMLAQAAPSLVILDVMLPELDGFGVVSRLRGSSDVPVLMLTARQTVADRVHGLALGADDYLVKPFEFEELLARIRALLRRAKPKPTEELTLGPVSVEVPAREVRVGSEPVPLTPREFDLLCYLLRHPNQALSRDQILSAVWGYDHEGTSNVVDVYIGTLRDKLEIDGATRILHTVRGIGYMARAQ
jgi:DNA-binding response OmpR family regulator